MEYNSDYSVRLATLGALGGDTTKCYNSVYEIDLAILDAIEHGGGGGGMDYDQIKAALAASGLTSILVLDGSGHTKEMDYALLDQIGEVDFTKVQSGLTNTGVTDILFDNGSGVTKVLDYDLVNQIGQGGAGDYICVNGVEALSGITNPKDGMLAYVGAYDETQERKVVVTDYYNKSWFHINVEWNDQSTAMLSLRTGGNDVDLTNGHFEDGQASYRDIHNHKDKMPYKMIFNNGAVGYVANQEYGSTYPENFETILTIWFDKYDGEFPTITFDYSEGGVLVSTAVTVENKTIHYKAIGYYKYYADVEEWLPYDIDFDTIDNALLQDIANDYVLYKKPLGAYRKTVIYGNDWSQNASIHYFAFGIYNNMNISFHAETIRKPNTNFDKPMFTISKQNDVWKLDNISIINIDQLINNKAGGILNNRLYTQHNDYDGSLDYGGLYSIPVEGTFSGTTYTTTIDFNPTATGELQGLGDLYLDNRKRRINISEFGCVNVERELTYSATTNADWHVINYTMAYDSQANNNTFVFGAVKIEDNGDDTFSVNIFVRDWRNTRFSPDGGRGYTWTETSGQTLAVSPAVYMAVRVEYGTQHRIYQTAKRIF